MPSSRLLNSTSHLLGRMAYSCQWCLSSNNRRLTTMGCSVSQQHTMQLSEVTLAHALTYNESHRRAHLIKCFEQKKLTRFPQSEKLSVTRPASQNLVIVVYCPCKKPDSFQNMIQCDQCGVWFHYTCAKVIKAPDDDWFCSNCK